MALALEGRRASTPSTSTSVRPASFLCVGHERRGHSSSSRLALASSAAAGQQQLAAADSLSQIAPPSYSTIDLSAVLLVATRARTPSPPHTPPATRAHANTRHAEPAPYSSFVCVARACASTGRVLLAAAAHFASFLHESVASHSACARATSSELCRSRLQCDSCRCECCRAFGDRRRRRLPRRFGLVLVGGGVGARAVSAAALVRARARRSASTLGLHRPNVGGRGVSSRAARLRRTGRARAGHRRANSQWPAVGAAS